MLGTTPVRKQLPGRPRAHQLAVQVAKAQAPFAVTEHLPCALAIPLEPAAERRSAGETRLDVITEASALLVKWILAALTIPVVEVTLRQLDGVEKLLRELIWRSQQFLGNLEASAVCLGQVRVARGDRVRGILLGIRPPYPDGRA